MNESNVAQKLDTREFVDGIDQFIELQREYESAIQPFFVEAWGRWVHVRKPNALERSVFEGKFVGNDRAEAVRFMKLDCCYLILCSNSGKPLFSNVSEARKVLGRQDGEAITQIAKKAEELMRIKKEDIEEATQNL